MERARVESEYVPAEAAIERLGIRRETLYAYASRGLVRTMPGTDSRSRRYSVEDLERLRVRRDARKGHAAVAAAALRFGEPVLESSITQITPDGPVYRGIPATELAHRGARFEAVAELLWSGELDERSEFPAPPVRLRPARVAALLPRSRRPFDPLVFVAAALAGLDPSRYDRRRGAQLEQARRLLPELAASVALATGGEPRQARAQRSYAAAVSVALGLRPTRKVNAQIDAALVLSADHELNASTFAARIAASAGADLYACLTAALATLSGPRHGGECDRVEAMLAEVGPARPAPRVVAERLRRGEALSGFGHPLYPSGDPRGRVLLERARALSPRRASVVRAVELAKAMRRVTGQGPTLDFGLVALCLALGAPPGSALALFALGRAAGWVAHVLEQGESPVLLRPRARYVARSDLAK